MVTISILLLPSFSAAKKNTSQKQIVLNKTFDTDTRLLAQKKSQLLKPFSFGKLGFKNKFNQKVVNGVICFVLSTGCFNFSLFSSRAISSYGASFHFFSFCSTCAFNIILWVFIMVLSFNFRCIFQFWSSCMFVSSPLLFFLCHSCKLWVQEIISEPQFKIIQKLLTVKKLNTRFSCLHLFANVVISDH